MKVGVVFPPRLDDPGEFLADARAMEAAGVDSVWIEDVEDGLDPIVLLAAVAAVTTDLRLGLISAGNSDARRIEALQQISRQRVIASPEGWRHVKPPHDREEWSRIVEEAERDAMDVLVPMDARLLDILRHPDEAIDRNDLVLAQG